MEDPECDRFGCGRYPKDKCSDLADDIIDYSSTKKVSRYLAREMVGRLFEGSVPSGFLGPSKFDSSLQQCDELEAKDVESIEKKDCMTKLGCSQGQLWGVRRKDRGGRVSAGEVVLKSPV